jgi:hypothetical protein
VCASKRCICLHQCFDDFSCSSFHENILVLFFVINEKNDSKNHIKQIGQWMVILKSVPVTNSQALYGKEEPPPQSLDQLSGVVC